MLALPKSLVIARLILINAELLAGLDIDALEETDQRRQIVGRDRDQRVARIFLGRKKTIAVAREDQQPAGEDVMACEQRRKIGRHRAEILADDQAVVLAAFLCKRIAKTLRRLTEIDTIDRLAAGGHQEEAIEAQNMIDAQRPRVPHQRTQD